VVTAATAGVHLDVFDDLLTQHRNNVRAGQANGMYQPMRR